MRKEISLGLERYPRPRGAGISFPSSSSSVFILTIFCCLSDIYIGFNFSSFHSPRVIFHILIEADPAFVAWRIYPFTVHIVRVESSCAQSLIPSALLLVLLLFLLLLCLWWYNSRPRLDWWSCRSLPLGSRRSWTTTRRRRWMDLLLGDFSSDWISSSIWVGSATRPYQP